MHRIFGDMIGHIQIVHVFIDDIIIYAKTTKEHNDLLRCVFDRLRLYGLTFKGTKCFFRQNEIITGIHNKLVHMEIKPDPSKCAAINSLAAPYDIKKSSISSWYLSVHGRFVKDYAEKTKPLSTFKKNY